MIDWAGGWVLLVSHRAHHLRRTLDAEFKLGTQTHRHAIEPPGMAGWTLVLLCWSDGVRLHHPSCVCVGVAGAPQCMDAGSILYGAGYL